MPSSPIARVRLIGKIEGVSFLLLLGVAMPLKYLVGFALAVKVVGWAHGLLFVALLWAVAAAVSEGRLGFKHALGVVVAALLPFGPFVADRSLAKLDASAAPNQA
jgi:integral membrane protein